MAFTGFMNWLIGHFTCRRAGGIVELRGARSWREQWLVERAVGRALLWCRRAQRRRRTGDGDAAALRTYSPTKRRSLRARRCGRNAPSAWVRRRRGR